jgi:hypothetical protein
MNMRIIRKICALRLVCSLDVRAFSLVLAFSVVTGLGPIGISHAQPQTPRTLDDMFSDVAKLAPDFGGMFLSEDESTLQVYLLDPSPQKVKAVETAIAQVFGRGVIPTKGIKAFKGQFGFAQLRQWHDRLSGPVLGVKGVRFTDIDEAKNRLRIGIENKRVEPLVVRQLRALGIPGNVVVIDVVAVSVNAPDPAVANQTSPEGGSSTIRDTIRPVVAGYGIIRNITGGGGCTIAFNASRTGGANGFVTSSWCTNTLWQLDGMSFFQGFALSTDLVGTETVDPAGFVTPGFPCPKYTFCRYSAAAFVDYLPGVGFAQGVIGRTVSPTTTSSPVLAIDAIKKFGIAGNPTQPYLIGLKLEKVGRKSGWTSGTISMTCANWLIAPNNLLLCQYSVANTAISMIADVSDFGAPVFRLRNFASHNWDHVELYGMLWGYDPNTQQRFDFSPIGGLSFQQSGIQSSTDLGPLDNYISCTLPPGPPTC